MSSRPTRRAVLTAALAAPSVAAAWSPFATVLPDAPLLDHRRRPWRFRSEAMAQCPVIALDLIYAGCTSICPLSTRVMAEARSLLGDEAVGPLRYLSLTLDPDADTPERLAEYAAAAGVAEADNWLFLTGTRRDVAAILRALRARFARPDDHAPVFFVGEGRIPRLQQLFAIPPPEELAAELRRLWHGSRG
ncbi:SCO family protein [Belnapia rosea]|uniref:Protein SCO1/2 n=1 Tax=Belnapia rosea TaxID=938405 RepID=A0A1G6YWP0_9PROT|nr:SCO family protein [Belnapia rosea]SDD94692.1 protein SCO1/2 [Belnapia rosea]